MACRFAPSPTGMMHIGNLRTAIFNYLFAKSKKIPYYLRIEDTDMCRSSRKYEQNIIDTCKFMNIEFDKFNSQDFVRQSDNHDQYIKFCNKLLEKKMAFYCFCQSLPEKFKKCPCREMLDNPSSETLKTNKPDCEPVIRFKTPTTGSTCFNDLNYGKIVTQNSNIEDFTLLRSNKTATYLLSVVVDDHLMDISHVIRGEDHRNNTPKQILIYEALDIKQPIFAHLPLIVDKTGKKLSKRSNQSNVQLLIEKGYTVSGIFNYLLKMGFGYKNEEIIPMERAIEIFSLERIKKNPCMFNVEKLQFLSKHYLRTERQHKDNIFEIVNKKYPYIKQDIFNIVYNDIIHRCCCYDDFLQQISFLDQKDVNFEKIKTVDVAVLKNICDNMQKIIDWTIANLGDVFNNTDKNIASQNLRLVLTNSDRSIGVLYILLLLGKEKSINRISRVIQKMESENHIK